MNPKTLKIKALITKLSDKISLLFNPKLVQQKNYQLQILVQHSDISTIEEFLLQMSPDLMNKVINKKQNGSFISKNKPNGGLAVLNSIQSVEVFNLLCQYGLDLSLLNDNGENALWSMVRQGQPDILKEMLKCGINPNILPHKDIDTRQPSLFVFMVEESIEHPELLKHLRKHMEALIEYGGQVRDFDTKKVSGILNTDSLEKLIHAYKSASPHNKAYIFESIKYTVEKVIPTLRPQELSQSGEELNMKALTFVLVLAKDATLFSYFLDKISPSFIEQLKDFHTAAQSHYHSPAEKQMISAVENKIQAIQIGKERDLIETMLGNSKDTAPAPNPEYSQAKRQKI